MENNSDRNKASVRPKEYSRKKKSIKNKQKTPDTSAVDAVSATQNKLQAFKVTPDFPERSPSDFKELSPPPSVKELSPPPSFKELYPPSFKELHRPALKNIYQPAIKKLPPPGSKNFPSACKELIAPSFKKLNSPGSKDLTPSASKKFHPGSKGLSLHARKQLPLPAFDDAPYRNPPSYEDLLSKKRIGINNNNESNTVSPLKEVNSKSKPMIVNLCDFVTPQVKCWRQRLLPLLCCARCTRLFCSARQPQMITAGTSACTECACQIYGISFHKAIKSYPLNTGYISTVHNLLYSLKIFQVENPFCSELDRGIHKGCNIKKINNLHFDLRQKLMHHCDCLENLTYLKSRNDLNFASVSKIIEATEICKEILLHSPTLKVKASALLKFFATLDQFKELFELRFEEYGGDEREWLDWNKMITTPRTGTLNKVLIKCINYFGLDMILFQDFDNKRFYSRLTAADSTIYLEAFTQSYPSVSLRNLGTFARFDPKTLEHINKFYFEIEISGGKDLDYYPLPFRYHVTLIHMDISWQTAYLFLGYKNCCFLGAEVEVTEDKVIFIYYLRNGQSETRNTEKPELWPHAEVPKPIKQGMVVSESKLEINKISIFKHDDPSKNVCYHLGLLNPVNLGSLRKIPLGRHKISACGIGILIDEY